MKLQVLFENEATLTLGDKLLSPNIMKYWKVSFPTEPDFFHPIRYDFSPKHILGLKDLTDIDVVPSRSYLYAALSLMLSQQDIKEFTDVDIVQTPSSFHDEDEFSGDDLVDLCVYIKDNKPSYFFMEPDGSYHTGFKVKSSTLEKLGNVLQKCINHIQNLSNKN